MTKVGRWLMVGAVLVSVWGCAGSQKRTHPLVKRASFDLSCPEDQLRWIQIDNRTWGVHGCGHKATYISTCEPQPYGVREDCTWVANTIDGRN